MGTHPIFESDFDCLTDRNSDFVKKMSDFGDNVETANDMADDWAEETQGAEMPSVKLFGRWSTDDIAVNDISLTDYFGLRRPIRQVSSPHFGTLPGETVSQGAMSDRRAFGELVDDARTQQRQEADDRSHRQTRVRDHPPHQRREPDPNPAPGDHQLGPARRLDPYRTRRNRPSSSRRRFAPPPRQPGDLAALHWR